MDGNAHLILFQEKEIRRIWHAEAWFFSVVDVVQTLTYSPNPRNYWNMLKKREPQLYTVCVQLKMPSADGKKYATDCANTEGLLRIIMAIPSPNAEPFKLWLARVGQERIDEIENPELAARRARDLYKLKGYPDDWIESRLKSIDMRQQLTDEWKGRGVQEGIEYSILTAEISKATFGMTPSEYKGHKGLRRENLRDHMTNLELIFTMLGEETTRKEAVDDDAVGFDDNRRAAIKGGTAAGGALQTYEKITGKPVVTQDNFLGLASGKKTRIKKVGLDEESNPPE